jgi:hypothetical protein
MELWCFEEDTLVEDGIADSVVPFVQQGDVAEIPLRDARQLFHDLEQEVIR